MKKQLLILAVLLLITKTMLAQTNWDINTPKPPVDSDDIDSVSFFSKQFSIPGLFYHVDEKKENKIIVLPDSCDHTPKTEKEDKNKKGPKRNERFLLSDQN